MLQKIKIWWFSSGIFIIFIKHTSKNHQNYKKTTRIFTISKNALKNQQVFSLKMQHPNDMYFNYVQKTPRTCTIFTYFNWRDGAFFSYVLANIDFGNCGPPHFCHTSPAILTSIFYWFSLLHIFPMREPCFFRKHFVNFSKMQ